jgi:DNA-directed RNA polymerase specialized sigma24 family protein
LDGVRDERTFLLRLAHNLAVDLMRRRSTRDKNEGKIGVRQHFSTGVPMF